MNKEFERNIGYKLHKLVHLLDNRADQLLEENHGIRFSQFLVLKTISRLENSSQRDISTCLDLTPAAISRHIDVLRAHGYVSRHTSPISRREHVISLTPKGEQILGKAAHLLGGEIQNLQTGLAKPELDAFHKVVDMMIERLQTNQEKL